MCIDMCIDMCTDMPVSGLGPQGSSVHRNDHNEYLHKVRYLRVCVHARMYASTGFAAHAQEIHIEDTSIDGARHVTCVLQLYRGTIVHVHG